MKKINRNPETGRFAKTGQLASPEEKFHSKYTINEDTGCWEWTDHINAATGYGSIHLKTPKRKTYRAHRFSYALYNGPIPKGKIVMHTCDNRACVNPGHLVLGTQRDNIRDMLDKGRNGYTGLPGSKHHKAKLTESDVILIRNRYRSGKCTHASLATEFGVNEKSIEHIVSGRTWRHVPGAITPDERKKLHAASRKRRVY